MGLDMYLYSYEKDSGLSNKKAEKINDMILNGLVSINGVAYWRKANEIHKWFVDNVQKGEDDCGYYEVTKENLEALNALCKQVLEECGENEFCFNSARASELLPTQSGFFFGNTDYNNWYIEDIKDTISQLDNILKEFDFYNNGLLYNSSW